MYLYVYVLKLNNTIQYTLFVSRRLKKKVSYFSGLPQIEILDPILLQHLEKEKKSHIHISRPAAIKRV